MDDHMDDNSSSGSDQSEPEMKEPTKTRNHSPIRMDSDSDDRKKSRRESREKSDRPRVSSKVEKVERSHRIEQIRKRYINKHRQVHERWSSSQKSRDNERTRETRRSQSQSQSSPRFSRFSREQRPNFAMNMNTTRRYYQVRMARLTNSNSTMNKHTPCQNRDGPSALTNWNDTMRRRINHDRKMNEIEAQKLEMERRRFEEEKNKFMEETKKMQENVQKKLLNVEQEEKKHQETLAHCQWWDGRLKDKEAKLLQDSIKFEQNLASLNEKIKKNQAEGEKLKAKHSMLVQDETRLVKEKEILLEFVSKCSALCGTGGQVKKEEINLSTFTNLEKPEEKVKIDVLEEGEIDMSKPPVVEMEMNDPPPKFDTLAMTPLDEISLQAPDDKFGSFLQNFRYDTTMDTTLTLPTSLKPAKMPSGHEQLRIIESVLGDLTSSSCCIGSTGQQLESQQVAWEGIKIPESLTNLSTPHLQTRNELSYRSGSTRDGAGDLNHLNLAYKNPTDSYQFGHGVGHDTGSEEEEGNEECFSYSSSYQHRSSRFTHDHSQPTMRTSQPQRQGWSSNRAHNERYGNGNGSRRSESDSSSFRRRYDGGQKQEVLQCYRCKMTLVGHANLKRHMENLHRPRPNNGNRGGYYDGGNYNRQNNRHGRYSQERRVTTIRRDGRRNY